MHPTRTPSRRTCSGEDHGYCCPDGIYLPQPDGTAVHRDDLDTPITVAEVLHCAALYLYRHGWHQGDMFDNPDQLTPAACAQGAIRMAVCGSPTTAYTDDTGHLVNQAIAVLAGHLHDTGYVDTDDYYGALAASDTEIVGDWNDETDRTVTEVIAALDDAADDWTRLHPGGAR
ncbi:MAG TPA: hypothetical protein VFB74_02255 [Kribbellaceae bacterium]|nr:hypothetical protein [Kribbellaceae bacterium]